MRNDLVNMTYVLKKLKAFKTSGKYGEEDITKLITQIEKHISSSKNDTLYKCKTYFFDIINDLEDEIDFNNNQIKPIKTDYKPYQERTYTKLNTLFRSEQILMSDDEAQINYGNDVDKIKEMFKMFLDLIDWLNDNKLQIIPEKTLFCAYLGISVEAYNNFLNKGTSSSVKSIFRHIDEYFTTNQFGALINNDRKALERIQKTEKYGQEMKVTQVDNVVVNKTVNLSYSDLMQQIQARRNNLIENKE